MIVYINDDGYLQSSLFFDNCNTPVEVSEEEWNTKLCSRKLYHSWKYSNGKWEYVLVDELGWLRHRRQRECFDYLDSRSKLWYNALTEEQNQELQKWYQDWLDVTTTKIMPRKPTWLK